MHNVIRTIRKRLPLILLLLTVISLGAMIFIRVSGSGTKLIYTDASKGRFIATFYNSSIIIFVVILILFLISVAYVNAVKVYRKKKGIPDRRNYDPEEEFEKPQADYITKPVEMPGYESTGTAVQVVEPETIADLQADEKKAGADEQSAAEDKPGQAEINEAQ